MRNVVVDDNIPWEQDYYFSSVTKSEEDQMWLPILEKALAKVYGSYMRLESGIAGEIF